MSSFSKRSMSLKAALHSMRQNYINPPSVTEGLAVQRPLHAAGCQTRSYLRVSVVSCPAHCAILTALFSSCIVPTAELVASFHKS